MILEQILKKNARYNPDKVAVIDGARRLTFVEVYQRSNRLANALLKLGMKQGSRIALMEKNCYQYFEFYFAVAKIGAVVVPVNFRFKKKELIYIVNNSEAEMLIFGEAFLDLINQARSELHHVKHFVMIGRKREGTESYDLLLENEAADPPEMETNENDVVVQMYTSGTTGFPKGTLITHRNIITTLIGLLLDLKITKEDVFLSGMTFFHVDMDYGLAFVMAGGTNVVMRQFSPEETLKLIQNEKVTAIKVVPTEINFILHYPKKELFNVKTLKSIYYGAMPISTTLLKEALAFFECDFYQNFGSTEGGFCSTLAPEDHRLGDKIKLKKRLLSAGRAAVLVEMKIVDNQGEEVVAGEIGEIVVKSESVMKGYWKLPEKTAEALKDGWLHFGDLGRIDEEGYLYLVDRKSDMIISGGENIYPSEIEEIISSHPSVQMAAVIGVPDEEWGESVKAIVVRKEGKKMEAEQIISFCKERLSGYKKPKSVEFIDLKSLPLTPTGKVLKRVLREKYWQGHERRIH